MDARVIRAMAQWPDVPDAYGWLGLDSRGNWKLRGERIGNRALIDFIGRNYGATTDGGYAFQNGPQRVHVKLDVAPWIADIATSPSAALPTLKDHTGVSCTGVVAAWLDSQGQLWFSTERGPALLRDDALLQAAATIHSPDDSSWDENLLADPDALDAADLRFHLAQGTVPLRALRAEPAQAFGFVLDPQPSRG